MYGTEEEIRDKMDEYIVNGDFPFIYVGKVHLRAGSEWKFDDYNSEV